MKPTSLPLPNCIALIFVKNGCPLPLFIILSLSPTIKVNHLKEERRRKKIFFYNFFSFPFSLLSFFFIIIKGNNRVSSGFGGRLCWLL